MEQRRIVRFLILCSHFLFSTIRFHGRHRHSSKCLSTCRPPLCTTTQFEKEFLHNIWLHPRHCRWIEWRNNGRSSTKTRSCTDSSVCIKWSGRSVGDRLENRIGEKMNDGGFEETCFNTFPTVPFGNNTVNWKTIRGGVADVANSGWDVNQSVDWPAPQPKDCEEINGLAWWV